MAWFGLGSLEEHEQGTTRRVIEDLEPYLSSIELPFVFVEPKTKAELLAGLASIAKRATEGLRPIIHIDTHGSERDGIYITASKELVSWQVLVDEFRKINAATENNLCVVSAACFGLNMIQPITITRQTPFFLIVAPRLAWLLLMHIGDLKPVSLSQWFPRQIGANCHSGNRFFLRCLSDRCFGDLACGHRAEHN